jgi:inorganic triphosphatase YgiF
MPADKRKPSRHTEVERKFAVTDRTISPSFDGLSSVAKVERSPVQQLDAVYFDTPGQDLAGHRVTLRRRTGGPDAGWHLKLPAGADARTEVRIPLDDSAASDDTVPDELRDVVLAIVRDHPLRPVARISTSRTVDLL